MAWPFRYLTKAARELDAELRVRLTTFLVDDHGESDASLRDLSVALEHIVTDFRKDRLLRKGGHGKPVNTPGGGTGGGGGGGGGVEPPTVATVVVTPSTFALTTGQSALFTAVARDALGNTLTGLTTTWASTSPSVATVDSSGLVTAVATGSTTIRATISGVSGTSTGTVTPVPVATVSVSPSSFTIQATTTQALTATVRDASSNVLTGRVVTWSSNNTSVATVSSTGVVTGVAAGSATITATCEGVTGTSAATITAAPSPVIANVVVTPNPWSAVLGATVQMTASVTDTLGNPVSTTVDWHSNNPSVATVNSTTGLVTTHATGTATILAIAGGVTGTATGTVTAVPVNTVTVSPSSFTINTAQTQQLTATLRDASNNILTGRQTTWTTSNASVAGVSSSGLVTPVAAGGVTITASAEGKSGTSTGTISAAPPAAVATVTVAPSTFTTLVGSTQSLTATVRDAQSNILTGRTVTWASSNTGVATVTSPGQTATVTAVAAGSATITATCETVPGTSAATITLVPVATVTVAPATFSVAIAGTQQLTATTKDALGNTLTGRAITWASTDTSVATVNASTGLVTGVGSGSCSITATSEGVQGVSAATVPSGSGGTEPVVISGFLHRLVSGTASTLVSCGLALQRGQLMPAGLSKVRALVGASEKQIYCEALDGRHADGSLRSILVQFTHTLTAGSPVAATIRLGEPRTTTDITKTTINTQATMPAVHPSYGIGADGTTAGGFSAGTHQFHLYGFPAGVFVPSGAHLRATGLLLPQMDRDAELALGGQYARRITDFENGAASRWTDIWSQPSFPGVFANDIVNVVYDQNYYDRSLGYFAHYFATGNVEYFRQACSYFYAWREIYARPSAGDGYRYNYQNAFPEGALLHYWLTGDPESRTMVVQQATHNLRSFAYDTCQGSRHNVNQDPREMAYATKNWAACYRLGLTTFTSRQTSEVVNVLTQCRLALDRMLGVNTYNNTGFFAGHANGESPMYQTSGSQDGVWAQTLDAACPTQLTLFMEGGLVPDVLIKYYLWVEADVRIPAAMKEAIDWVWTNHWRPNRGLTSEKSFDYLTAFCSGEGSNTASPDLNHLYTHNFAWAGRNAGGGSTYYTRALDIMTGSSSTDVSSDLVSSGKLFNQQQVLSYPAAKAIQG